jgi:hypothetical protein
MAKSSQALHGNLPGGHEASEAKRESGWADDWSNSTLVREAQDR